MNTFDLTLDLSKRGVIQTVQIRQGDKSGTTIRAAITDHGVAASTSGMTARFSMRLPNGTEYYRKTATLSGNVATVTIDEAQAASVAGRTDVAYFQLLQGSTVVASTESFTVIVLPDALADAEVAESYDSAIQDAIDALDDAVEQLPSTVEDVLADHPEWTTTVQDGSITEPKLAADLTHDRERLLYRLANMLTNALPEGETATATDAAKTPMAALALYGKSTQDGTPTPSSPVPIVSVEGNLYGFMDAGTRVNNGVTWTPQADGTIKATGTATGISFGLATPSASDKGKSFFVHIEAGVAYTATSFGEVEFNVYRMKLDGTADTYVGYSKADKTFTVTEECWVAFVPRVASGTTYDATYRIALVKGTTAAQAYVPYDHMGLWAKGANLLNPKSLMRNAFHCSAADNGDGTLTITSTMANVEMWVGNIITSAGTAWTSANSDPIPVTPSGTVYIANWGTADRVFVNWWTKELRTISYADMNMGGTTVKALTVPANAHYVTVRVGKGAEANTEVGKTFTVKLMVAYAAPSAFQPYESTVTPVPLDGHELRSLPDGTRDELTVGADGHAVLVQRVRVIDASSTGWQFGNATPNSHGIAYVQFQTGISGSSLDVGATMLQSTLPKSTATWANTTSRCAVCNIQSLFYRFPSSGTATLDNALADMAANGGEFLIPLATPVTHDLGYVAAVPLVGPDLTAQAVPTAPFALTYERDLNTTLARLESAIATLA